MTITIFILFILYTIGCCLDGSDLKPKWKKWLGGKLERMANSLKPINYCNPHSRLCPKWVNPMVDALRHNEDLKKLYSYVILSDSELRDARINELLAERNGGNHCFGNRVFACQFTGFSFGKNCRCTHGGLFESGNAKSSAWS